MTQVPASSHSGGGPVAGTYLPVASPSGVTVDTTTYDNPITGSGKLTTLVFPTGVDTGLLAVALAGDAFPSYLLTSNGHDGIYMGDGTIDPYGANGAFLGYDGPGPLLKASRIRVPAATAGDNAVRWNQVSPVPNIQSGALGTVQLVSGAGTTLGSGVLNDAETVTPVTFNPGAATTATCTVALSPDNVTYSTLGIETVPAGVALDGTIHLIKVRVPVGWYIKLTVNAQATLGVTTFY